MYQDLKQSLFAKQKTSSEPRYPDTLAKVREQKKLWPEKPIRQEWYHNVIEFVDLLSRIKNGITRRGIMISPKITYNEFFYSKSYVVRPCMICIEYKGNAVNIPRKTN